MLTAESSTIVTLTPEECEEPVAVGGERHRRAEAKNYRQTDLSDSPNGEANHKRGALAERAFAKFYGLKWDATIDGYGRVPDQLLCEIRGTRPQRDCLRIKLTDKPQKSRWIFASVTNLGNRRFRMDGWIHGYEGMLEKYKVIDPDSKQWEYNVPFDVLHAPFTLEPVLSKLVICLGGIAPEEQ